MSLNGKRIVILVESDFQDIEVHYPRLRLIEEGADVYVVGTGSAPSYKGKYGTSVSVNIDVKSVDVEWVDCVIIPGGWAPDRLRQSKGMVNLVAKVNDRGRIIGCICHGGWLLASANVIKGKKLTSYFAIRDDLVNAGAEWVDEEVTVDGNLITSRNPDDLPAFMREIIRALKD